MKNHSRFIPLAALLFIFAANVFAQNKTLEVRSPNGRVKIAFALNDSASPVYSVAYDKRTVTADSTLGLDFKAGGLLSKGMRMTNAKRASHDEIYNLVVGKSAQARDHYNELTVSLEEKLKLKRKLQLVFRAYDDGAAFRYVIPQQTGMERFEIVVEKTEFRLPEDFKCWAMQLKNFKSNYEKGERRGA